MLNYAMVALGGGLGAMSRYGLGQWLSHAQPAMPWGTLAANVLGCLLMGVLLQFSGVTSSETAKALLIVGFCGGFTTMSAFVFDISRLWQDDIGLVAFYFFGTLLLCGGAFFIGLWAARTLLQAE